LHVGIVRGRGLQHFGDFSVRLSGSLTLTLTPKPLSGGRGVTPTRRLVPSNREWPSAHAVDPLNAYGDMSEVRAVAWPRWLSRSAGVRRATDADAASADGAPVGQGRLVLADWAGVSLAARGLGGAGAPTDFLFPSPLLTAQACGLLCPSWAKGRFRRSYLDPGLRRSRRGRRGCWAFWRGQRAGWSG